MLLLALHLCPWDSPGKNTGVGYHAFLQGIFPIQGLNPDLPHCRWIHYYLSHQGSPLSSIVKHLVWVKLRVFQAVVVVKNLPANAEDIRDTSSIPRSGRSPGGGHGNPLQYSCLENPMDRGALQVLVAPLSYKESDSTEATEHKHTLSEVGHSSRYFQDNSL